MFTRGGKTWTGKVTVACAAVLAALLCPVTSVARPLTREDLKPAPSSSLTKSEALGLGAAWKQGNPTQRDYCEVHPTGSMAPVIDSRSVLLLERVSATELRKNDISIYLTASPNTTMCHRVIEVRSDGVLFEGDNNQRSDGWIAPERIRWRVVAIIFTRRDAETEPGEPARQETVDSGRLTATGAATSSSRVEPK